jgi:hypothetical protein
MYASDVWNPDDDMIKDLLRPFENNPMQHFHDDFQPSLGSCDADPFGDVDLFYEEFQRPSSSIFDGHQDVAILEKSKAHSTKESKIHIEDFYRDS